MHNIILKKAVFLVNVELFEFYIEKNDF